jgi:hypothetical protein
MKIRGVPAQQLVCGVPDCISMPVIINGNRTGAIRTRIGWNVSARRGIPNIRVNSPRFAGVTGREFGPATRRCQ